MTALALALLATPFAFGLARLITTGSDWRYLVVALASTLGAGVVMLRRRSGVSWGTGMRVLVGVGSAALLASLGAVAVGARSGTAIAMVAIGFALCSGGGAALITAGSRSS
jgi:hypothetical protein